MTHHPADPACPWVGGCQCDRDAAMCVCGHPNARHATREHIGDGACPCGCDEFQETA